MRALLDAETALNGHAPLLVLDSHDRPRSWTRYADGVHDLAIAKLLATYMLAPRGAALIYYGQEIGIENNDPKRREDVQDPVGRRGWPVNKGRDGERTPMQWTAGPNAGFSTAARTWLPLATAMPSAMSPVESASPDSLLNYYKALIRLRGRNRALRDGDLRGGRRGRRRHRRVDREVRRRVGARRPELQRDVRGRSAVDAAAHGLRTTRATTLLSPSAKAGSVVGLGQLTLPAYGAFIGTVR